MNLKRGVWVAFAAALAALPACEESPVIGERMHITERFVDIRNVVVDGQARLEYRATVPSDAIHPHILGRWTVDNIERPVDVYVFRADLYDPNQPLATQPYFFTSVPAEGSGVNQQRSNDVRIHPTIGDWIVVFFNPGLNPVLTRTELSAEVEINYFR